jgi:ubiquinone/menaquinone biosynthesis C-methylase UbiE
MGLGLNEEELKANPAYTEWKVHDLNASKIQDWTWLETETMNAVICTVSIDYLIYPISVLKECYRVLRPGTSRCQKY